jgi:hypothetical protein
VSIDMDKAKERRRDEIKQWAAKDRRQAEAGSDPADDHEVGLVLHHWAHLLQYGVAG